MTANKYNIIVLGTIIRAPLGGSTWSKLQYIIGLLKLGHRVYYLEDSDDFPSCYDPTTNSVSYDTTYGINYAKKLFKSSEIENSWAFYDASTSAWRGPLENCIANTIKNTDIIINLCGVTPLRSWFMDIPVRILIDQDPAFTQLKNIIDKTFTENIKKHNHFFSFGENIHQSISKIPDDKIHYHTTRQPVVLESKNFKPKNKVKDLNFTTIMRWESYKNLKSKDLFLGMKSDSFYPYIELPKFTDSRFEIAMGGKAPRELLRSKGWILINPLTITRNISTYIEYILNSKAEFSVAKQGYVTTNSGWFSERSVAYISHYRPTVIQDTGFSRWLPTGKGILKFNNVEEVLDSIDKINTKYEYHCSAAREIAESYFDYRYVLGNLLDKSLN